MHHLHPREHRAETNNALTPPSNLRAAARAYTSRVITAHDVAIAIGARDLLSGASFRVDAGDRIGLVGRNGAGKATLTKVLAGGGDPTGGTVHGAGSHGYPPPA